MNLEESIKITVEGCGASLYDIAQTKENDKNIYRVYITSKDGVNLDKCAEISRLISPILDIHEPMNGEYYLEVSSPGIERKLKTLDHFKASIGELVRIKDFDKNRYNGKLLLVEDSKITVQIDGNENLEIEFNDISSASTYFDWGK